jgi:tetrahydromethanopterin S-methyltransferase subunit F
MINLFMQLAFLLGLICGFVSCLILLRVAIALEDKEKQ